jgi:hypothetical protein
MKKTLILMLVLLVFGLFLMSLRSDDVSTDTLSPPIPIPIDIPAPTSTPPVETVEQYVRDNISELSSTKEQLGGKFFVTKIEALGGTGTVWYEDGHNAYVADFNYDLNASGNPTVTSFKIRE